MSQLFLQPSFPAQTSRFRHYTQPSACKVGSPAKPAGPAVPAATAPRKRPPTKWWERQTTTELEVTGTVDDVINPGLLVAGKAEVGEKAVAVASLRELWDEERARSRAAGGGSQLSAPPGLELADSQDTWEPPESLLTQDMRGAVDDLARSVVQKNPSAKVATSAGQSLSQPRSSQASPSERRGNRPEFSLSPHVELTPSPEGVFSQASMGNVASVSDSPANYLVGPYAPDPDDGSDSHEALLDMLAALRGSQSQSHRDEGGMMTQNSPPKTRHGTQSSHDVLSQDPVSTPADFADQAEAIAETQVR